MIHRALARSLRAIAALTAVPIAALAMVAATPLAADAAGAEVITEYPIATPNSLPLGMTTGPDGNIRFTEKMGNNIATISLEPPRAAVSSLGVGSAVVGATVYPGAAEATSVV